MTAYRPDLTVTDLVLPTTAQAGRPLAIKHTVRNLGPAPAGASAVRFFLSADDTLDTGDVLLGSRSLAGLAAGVSSTAITTLTLPGNTSVPATYRVIAVADALGQAVELDETNNTSVSSPLPITPYRPDLTISALTIPVTAQAGRPIALKHTVRNLGPAPTGTFTLRFFLSSDDALDAGDVLLGSRSLGSLAGGITSTVITTLTLPGDISVPATYRVIAVAEPLGQTVELDATNNVGRVVAASDHRVPAGPHDLGRERPGHGSGGPTAGHHPHRPEHRLGAGRSLRHPVLPFSRRRAGLR